MTSSSEKKTKRSNTKNMKKLSGSFLFFPLQKRKIKAMKNEKDEKRDENGNRGRKKAEKN